LYGAIKLTFIALYDKFLLNDPSLKVKTKMIEQLNQPVLDPTTTPPAVEVQAQEALNPRVLGREGATEAVGAELGLFEQQLGAYEASTGHVDEEARRILELVPDVIKHAESFAFDSGNPTMSLSEAIKGHNAALVASGALDPKTKSTAQGAELARLYARAIGFATATSGRVEGDYRYYYDRAANEHPANSRQTHAATARALVFEKYGELNHTDEASPAEDKTAWPETPDADPATRAEKIDALFAEERARMLSDPDSIEDAAQMSRSSVSRLATAARKKHEAAPTAATERTLKQYKEYQQDFTFLGEQIRLWQVRRAEGGPADFSAFMTEARASQDSELERYAEAGGKIPQDVDQRMEHFDRAYRAFAGSSNYTTFSDAISRLATENAHNRANG
jgi:hypothetical protein